MKALNELLDLAKQDELDELDKLAAEAQGWLPIFLEDGGKVTSIAVYKKPNNSYEEKYHPTRDKAQAVDLMLKADLLVHASGIDRKGVIYTRVEYHSPIARYPIVVDHEELPVAVTIAFILAMQGEE